MLYELFLLLTNNQCSNVLNCQIWTKSIIPFQRNNPPKSGKSLKQSADIVIVWACEPTPLPHSEFEVKQNGCLFQAWKFFNVEGLFDEFRCQFLMNPL